MLKQFKKTILSLSITISMVHCMEEKNHWPTKEHEAYQNFMCTRDDIKQIVDTYLEEYKISYPNLLFMTREDSFHPLKEHCGMKERASISLLRNPRDIQKAALLTLRNLACDLEIHFLSELLYGDPLRIIAGDTVGENVMVAFREIHPGVFEDKPNFTDLTFREYVIDGQNYNFLSHDDITSRRLRPNENNRLALYINPDKIASGKIALQNMKGTITVYDKPQGNETLVIEQHDNLKVFYEIGFSFNY